MRTLLFFSLLLIWACQSEPEPDFNTEVRPILNEHCLSCHGGVKKSGDISFLFREEALVSGRSGKPCIVPGKPGQSELIARLESEDPNQRMPLDGEPLAKEEIEILRRWIRAGAKWEKPWSYQALQLVAPPEVGQLAADWTSPIDAFLLAEISKTDLQPKPPQAPERLIRRLSLDLTGLPPKPAWVAAYRKDPSLGTYQAIIDSLLDSPHFGERWAAPWLDLARYADTKGFERDGHREIWAYRDWLIEAFNRDMPYDTFCIQQMAGDLLPQPSKESLMATAFHRNTMSNDEGGTLNEEFRLQAVMDRVNTSWSVFLGTTISCVQCHSHPYDPIRHEEYYQSLAVFNNDLDEDTHHDAPLLSWYSPEDSLDIRALQAYIEALPLQPEEQQAALTYTDEVLTVGAPLYHPHHFTDFENAAHWDGKWLLFRSGEGAWVRLPQVELSGKKLLLLNNGPSISGREVRIHLGAKDGPLLATIAGVAELSWKHQVVLLDSAVLADAPPLADLYWHSPSAAPEGEDMAFTWVAFLEKPFPGDPADWLAWGQSIVDRFNSEGRETLPILQAAQGRFARTTQVFDRGSWLVLTDTVTAAVPASLSWDAPDLPAGRLDFAQWMTNPQNPLTARVAVNRFWEQLFGRGLVETSEDFGSQGTPPSHPELLDYLAYTFMTEDKWSMKQLLRRLVSTGAYRQAARANSLDLAVDPYNRLLARGPRNRLSAEQVRDQALAVAGLLDSSLCGPSVMPPQPEGIWQVVYNGDRWETETADLHRRALYTYWRRTSPYPSMETFDSPSREVCVIRRIPTNTPLQALVTLNDPVYLEVALRLAEQLSPTEEAKLSASLDRLFNRLLFRSATEAELQILEPLYRTSLLQFLAEPAATIAYLRACSISSELPELAPSKAAKLAAFTTVVNTVLNLDVLLTK
ncbi:MAG: PSD1 and planctomycete cytochrome C domain-containing protein [Bacteroidota bacterium]